jgi:hypothetical protein
MTTVRKLARIIALILMIGMITGCAAATPTPTEDAVGTMVAATFQALTQQAPTPTPPLPTPTVPSATPTIPTATLPPPTSTPTATLSPASGAVRLNFAPGATFGVIESTLQPGQSQTYVLGAGKGQPAIVMVTSPNGDVTMGITGKDGTVLLAGPQGQNWQGYLPSTQDYFVKVNAGAAAENYTLSVTIASRIAFAVGATSATVTGSTVGGYNVTYALNAKAGQTMKIDLTAPAGSAALTVWGFSDGQPYQRSVTGSTTFNMVLPSSQDYIVEVVPQAGQVVAYSMKVEIK